MKTHYRNPAFTPPKRENATGKDRGLSLCGYDVRVTTLFEPGDTAQPSCPVCRNVLRSIRQAPDQWREIKIPQRVFTELVGTPSGPPTGYRAPIPLGRARGGYHGTPLVGLSRE